MKNKGFTLIELLAVIIILGLIAVITIPKINESINDSKRKLAEASALSYTKAIQEYTLKEQMNKNTIKLNGEYNINSNGNIYNETEEYEIEITGKKPTNGTLTYNENDLETACITFGKYAVTIENDEITNSAKGNCEYTSIESEIIVKAQAYASSVETEKTGETEFYNLPITEITDENITSGWIGLINGETNSYSLKIGSYVVNFSNGETSITKTSELASSTTTEQAIVSYKVDTYVKAALTANSSLTENTVKEVSELSSVTTNSADSGWIQFGYSNSTVSIVDYSLTYGTINANYSSLTNGNYVSTFGTARNRSVLLAGTNQTDGAKYLTTVQEVYYNPVSGATNCSGQEGCMHWYLYSVKGDYANMMLDHNINDAGSSAGAWAIESDYTAGLTAQSGGGYQIGEGTDSKATSAGITYPSTVTSFNAYSNNKNARGPVTALNTLKTLTSGWSTGTPKVPNASSTNEHIIPSSANNNQYQIDYTGYHARLITKEEAGYLGCTTSSNSCPEWMMKATYGENSTTYSNIYGYWTSSPNASNANNAWNIDRNHNLDSDASSSTSTGVRPVITVLFDDVL